MCASPSLTDAMFNAVRDGWKDSSRRWRDFFGRRCFTVHDADARRRPRQVETFEDLREFRRLDRHTRVPGAHRAREAEDPSLEPLVEQAVAGAIPPERLEAVARLVDEEKE